MMVLQYGRLLWIAVLIVLGAPGIRPAVAADPAMLLPAGIVIGMHRSALQARQPSLRRLEPPLNFGPVQAEFVDVDAEFLGARATLYLQINPTDGRLRQAFFEWRDAQAPPGHAAALLDRLERHLGEPRAVCRVTVGAQPPRLVSANWRGASVQLYLSMFDFHQPGIAYFDLNSDSDPRQPSFERRRITRRSLPRRLIARIHAVEDPGLAPRQGCPGRGPTGGG